MRVTVLSIITAVFVSVSVVSAGRRPDTPEKQTRLSGASITPSSYRSPGRLHKITLSNDDSETLAEVLAGGAVEISDYGSFKLLAVNESSISNAERQIESKARSGERATGQLRVRDDFNVLLLRSGVLDTTSDDAPGTFVGIGELANDSARLSFGGNDYA
ncbi:MAG TPA: hypothetical protein VKF81_01630, partial [Blastocatellia bacterium]|nr:hypothetical protein [Blastocatellia bacterium]